MVAYVLREQQKMSDSEIFLSAGKRIMKDRKNLLNLTKNARSTNTSYEEESSFLKIKEYNSFWNWNNFWFYTVPFINDNIHKMRSVEDRELEEKVRREAIIRTSVYSHP